MRAKGKRGRSLLLGLLTLALSLSLFLHILTLVYRKHEVEIELTVSLSSLMPELATALEEETVLSLDGRFPLSVRSLTLTPSLLRFYDAAVGCEFTVPSRKYSDSELILTAKAREHPFGYALGGVRTVTVGSGVTLYGERCKIYGTVSAIQTPTRETSLHFYE